MTFKKYILSLSIILLLVGSVNAQGGTEQLKPKLRVGLKVDPPYVMKEVDGTYYGLSVDIWIKVSSDLTIPYEFVEYTHIQDMVYGLSSRKIDIAINPLTVSSQRVRQLEVTQPFLTSSMAVAIQNSNDSQIIVFFSNLASGSFLELFGVLVLIVFGFGVIVWFVERQYNPTDFRDGIYGVMDGIWWSTVTITTVGYGDKTPKTTVGKIISMVWMFAAISLISSFTATIASTLTVNRLETEVNTLRDLKKIGRIGTIRNSDTEDYLSKHQIELFKTYESTTEGLEDLRKGIIKAFAYDRAVIHYLIADLNLDDEIKLVPTVFNRHFLSWNMRRQHPLYRQINPLVADFIGRESWEKYLQKYNMEHMK